ncbi:Transglycosylase SLT domain protein [Streptomyces sp. S4.7]|uniref:transglycosylase SLT domain-containing protein n=1 Tax=Streptomyces sp. S4.7 TaxID=2705439 RepID=UPI0013978943|nr:transglycosylase SLT domain-containing protein [Streptomyces sp. S4.7]QHY94771.1 Transglycosylase SLT domain protein [Streptomyces sp. S4.7]
MTASSTTGNRLKKSHKLSIAGVTAVAAAAVSFSLIPGNASAESQSKNVAASVSTAPAAWNIANGSGQAAAAHKSLTKQDNIADRVAEIHAKQGSATATVKADTKDKTAAEKKATAKAKAAEKAKKRAAEKAKANRSADRKPAYANNLNGWIKEALSIMKKEKIPGTYEGLHRNIIRESSGDPRAINNWDINAKNGVPSIGLLQVIKPTFDAYHVKGTPDSQYHPVANIVAAANYAADRYGSIDNVDSAY